MGGSRHVDNVDNSRLGASRNRTRVIRVIAAPETGTSGSPGAAEPRQIRARARQLGPSHKHCPTTADDIQT